MVLYCSENIKELTGAMLKVQAEITPAIKDGENPFAKSKYATLNSVVEASREALLKHGIWLVQYSVPADTGCLGLMTKLVHAASGQWQASLLVMPLPKADPQGCGSALTYARRYALASLVGLVTEDDDGEAGCGRNHQRDGKNKASKNQVPGGQKEQKNEASSEPAAGVKTDSEADSELDILKNLPKLDGINYQAVKAGDGKMCVIATGNTAPKKEILANTGFRWNAERKVWWKYAYFPDDIIVYDFIMVGNFITKTDNVIPGNLREFLRKCWVFFNVFFYAVRK